MTRQNLTRQNFFVGPQERFIDEFVWEKSIFQKSMKKSKNQRIFLLLVISRFSNIKYAKKNVNNKIQNFNLNIELLCNIKKTLFKLSSIIYNLSYEL